MSRDPSPSSASSDDQSWEDTDAAWGDYSSASSGSSGFSGNDERLLEDRPPHWDDY